MPRLTSTPQQFKPDPAKRAANGHVPPKEHINHPAHYGGDTVYEAIKVIHAWDLGFDLGNAVKYLSRAGKKDPARKVEDLRKAIWYIESEIARSKES